jgi:hypothetical protein
MTVAETTAWISAAAAAGGFLAASYQLAALRRAAVRERAGEIRGVAVETDVLTRPLTAPLDSIHSAWEYNFTVHNPGRFPITEVAVVVRFPMPVRRSHGGGDTADEPSSDLDMYVPVVPARGSKSWHRWVLVPHVDHEQLRRTVSIVKFTSSDAGRVENHWPNPKAGLPEANRRLKRQIGDLAIETPLANESRPSG